MRARSVGISAVAGLALAAGLAVGGDADDGLSGGARPEPRGAGVRVDRRALHGPTTQSASRSPDRDGLRMGLLKTRAIPSSVRVAQALSRVDGRLSWAVRVFDRPRLTGGSAARTRIDTSRPGIPCAQLGRVRGRSFGWVLPDGAVFRPLGAETDLQAVCATDAGSTGIAAAAVLLPDRDPSDPAARIRGTAVWGLAPASVRRVRISWAGWTRTVPVRGGTFLAQGPAPGTRFVERDARVVDADAPARQSSRGRPSDRPRLYGQAQADRPRIAARLVDPSTGRPSVVVTGTVRDRPCDGGVQPFTAGVVGGVNATVQTVYGRGRACQVIPVLKRGAAPMLVGYGGGIGNAPQDGPDLVGRERLVPGGYAVSIITPPDVVRVELRAPGDVRTVRPVAPGVVHALYDGSANARGDFTGSGVDVIGIRADGSRIRALEAGGPPSVQLGSAELEGR